MSEHHLITRTSAAQATLDEWRGRRLRLGEADCARMVASHLRRMGYQVRMPPRGAYRTAQSAVRAIRAAGYGSMADGLDALGLPRIAPAAALVGDIIEMPSAIAELGAMTIAMGNGRIFGWWDDGAQGAVVMQPVEMVRAWRVMPAALS